MHLTVKRARNSRASKKTPVHLLVSAGGAVGGVLGGIHGGIGGFLGGAERGAFGGSRGANPDDEQGKESDGGG